ncbi:MFS transporter [Streptomyces sp. NPDC088817]|uniref:MFS transporter n=1 Tax=unclassified Streptomyces TaxID=2593676 RepID=UPI0036E548BE
MLKQQGDGAVCREEVPVWRVPGMRPLLASTALGFAGLSLLMPAAPLWALEGGADELGAGLVNTVLMLFTVIAQLLVGRILGRLGWQRSLALGSCLLGLPALGHLVTSQAGAVMALAAVRGLGFGILTVCGASGVAALVEPARRGRAVGAYGLAIATPQCLLIPVAPWLAQSVGFWLVFTCAAVPLLAIPLAPRVARALHDSGDVSGAPVEARDTSRLRRVLVGPIAALLVITAAGGAILTFTPRLLSDSVAVYLALLAFTATAALSRWGFGHVADRRGAAPAIAPLLFAGAAGLAVIGAGAAGGSGAAGPVLVVAGMFVVGVAYGGLQNLTLVQAFAAAGERARSSVSVAWNVGFDAGTGLGAFAAGAVVTVSSYTVAYTALAAVTAVVGACWAAAWWRNRGAAGGGALRNP